MCGRAYARVCDCVCVCVCARACRVHVRVYVSVRARIFVPLAGDINNIGSNVIDRTLLVDLCLLFVLFLKRYDVILIFLLSVEI